MAVKKMQSAMNVARHAETRGSTGTSGVDDLLGLTDDDLAALMPPASESNLSLRAREALPPQGSAARPSPKASGKFVTDGGRLVGPKIVKRVKKREEAVPMKASGAYAKAVVAATQAEPAAPSTKLEDFSDLVSELESLVDLPRQVDPVLIPNNQVQVRLAEAPRVFEANADVHATISEAVQAALPQMVTVPLSVATLATAQTAASARAAAVAQARVEAEDVTSTSTSTTADAMRASPIPAGSRRGGEGSREAGRLLTILTAVALLGVVGGAGWMAWRHGLVTLPQTAVVAPAAPAAEATTVTVVPATVVPAAPATPAEPTEAAEEQAAASDVAPTVAGTKPAPPTARMVAAPTGATGEGTAAAAEPAKGGTRVAAKPARRARATKASDDTKSNGAAGDEVDEETKKALEALQKSQLESSF